ncbi:MAG: tripartite tricarboxylate transporter substrate binding protein [Betaproteobacteria bacterium]|nr:tripartite tricarboxylate transporter substrate binding protein [Betaproteobacteria bacterium]
MNEMRTLATWIADLKLSGIPNSVKVYARRFIVANFGCHIAGAMLPWSQVYRDVLCRTHGSTRSAVSKKGVGMSALPRALVIAVLATILPSASAQQYPSKLIRFIVPYPPGGGTDFLTRLLAKNMSEAWDQRVLVENRPGAEGNVGTAIAAKEPPDGYTIFLGTNTSLTINPFTYRNVGYNPITDFAPITHATTQPYFIVAHPSLPVRSFKEFVAFARANPAKLNVGTSGSSAMLAAELLNVSAKIKITPIPYKGSGPALLEVLAGQIELAIGTPAGPLPFVRSGKLRLLAVTSSKRLDIVPDSPTVAESGFPGYEVTGWYGVLAPGGTPNNIVAKLNAELVRTLRLPQTKELLARSAVQPVGSTAEEFSAFIKSEAVKWGELVKQLGIEAQ